MPCFSNSLVAFDTWLILKNMFSFKPCNFSKSLFVFGKIYVLSLLIFTLNRFIFFFRFAEPDLFSNQATELWEVMKLGFRFDTKIIIVLLLPLLALSILLTLIYTPGFQRLCQKIYYWYTIVLLSVTTFLLFVDQQYYTYFQSHFNGMIFGLVQDDTVAVLISMWKDHPVLRIVFVVVLFTITIHFILKQILKNLTENIHLKWYSNSAIALLSIFLIFSGIRGSYSTFPLEKDDLNISDHPFINYLASNAFFALHTTIEDRSRTIGDDMDNGKLLSSNGYNSIDEVLFDYYDNKKN